MESHWNRAWFVRIILSTSCTGDCPFRDLPSGSCSQSNNIDVRVIWLNHTANLALSRSAEWISCVGLLCRRKRRHNLPCIELLGDTMYLLIWFFSPWKNMRKNPLFKCISSGMALEFSFICNLMNHYFWEYREFRFVWNSYDKCASMDQVCRVVRNNLQTQLSIPIDTYR